MTFGARLRGIQVDPVTHVAHRGLHEVEVLSCCLTHTSRLTDRKLIVY